MEHLRSLFSEAGCKRKACEEGEELLARAVRDVLEKIFRRGEIIDIEKKPIPQHLIRISIVKGNAYGATLFKIVELNNVSIDSRRPYRTTWEAWAFPLSLKNGKELSKVLLSGSVSHTMPDEPLEQMNRRFFEYLSRIGDSSFGEGGTQPQ